MRSTDLRRLEEHGVCDVMSASDNHAQRDAREDVRVVALSRIERLPVVGHRTEGTSTGKDALALQCEFVFMTDNARKSTPKALQPPEKSAKPDTANMQSHTSSNNAGTHAVS